MAKKVWKCFLGLLICSANAWSQTRWVDSVFATLSVEEKIGQLMMVQVRADKNTDLDELEDYVKNNHIGGIIFMEGGPVRQVNITNHLQQITQVPLLIGQDAEWGPGMMLDSTLSFPRALLLGAIRNDSLVYNAGREIAREMKILGVHVNFAPVTGVNTNPENELSYRSFGSNKINVANKAVAFMKGMQDDGILACAKNFPVSGVTVLDIQNGLPIFKPYLDSIQTFPFKKLFEAGLVGIIPAAADFPLFYENKNLIRKNKFSSSALTSIFMGEWLKNQMHFTGLLFANIPATQSTTNKYRSGEAEMFAFEAGNDILLAPLEVGPAIRKIKKLIKNDDRYEAQLNNSVLKILKAKFEAGLAIKHTISNDNLVANLNSPQGSLVKQDLYKHAITIIKNETNTLPVRVLENKHFAYLTFDSVGYSTSFLTYLSKYEKINYFNANNYSNNAVLSAALKDQQVIIVTIFPQTSNTVLERGIPFLETLAQNHEVIICDFGHQTFLKQAEKFSTLITAYVNSTEMLELVPQVIFGGEGASGKLPYSPSIALKEGMGIITPSLNRFSYSIPEDAGMDSETLTKIERIANEAISIGATPGCQVFVARHGKVIYEKSFGYLTYDNKIPVTNNVIYDLASVTKVSATLQAVMFLQERGMIDINKKIAVYLPEFKKSNKKDFTIKDILTHQAGLWPFLPFWAQTMKDSLYLPEFYNKIHTESYPLMVAENLYAPLSMRDSLWNWIVKSKIREKASRTPFDYKYSDMGFYILQHLAEKLLNQPLEDFIQQNLYEPLGSVTTGYLPLARFPVTQIAPTENDKLFRKTLLIGTVHDQGAAMMGGVAGHAGLFSDAADLAKLGQMLLQEGNYGGNQFYKPATVKLFTQKQFETSRRGLGWDKPIQSDWNRPTSMYSSPKTFGHTGFTGTCIWVDPEFDLVYVFLSNRVNPSMTNNKLLNSNIRPRIQDVIYQSIFNYCQF